MKLAAIKIQPKLDFLAVWGLTQQAECGVWRLFGLSQHGA